MSDPVVVDTAVFGAELAPQSASLAQRYEPHLTGRVVVISFVTAAELRYGAARARWGDLKRRRLERLIAGATIVWPDERLVAAYVGLRVESAAMGHGLAGKVHEADRWVAATALWLGIPLVAHDRIFRGVPGLTLLTELD